MYGETLTIRLDADDRPVLEAAARRQGKGLVQPTDSRITAAQLASIRSPIVVSTSAG